MKEKVFTTLFRLISSGQLTVEEAYYLMKTLFSGKDKDTNDNPFGVIHQVPPYTVADPGLHPWWESNTITAGDPSLSISTTGSSPNVYAVTTSTPIDYSPQCATSAKVDSTYTVSATCNESPIELGGNSDTSKQAMSLEDLDNLLS